MEVITVYLYGSCIYIGSDSPDPIGNGAFGVVLESSGRILQEFASGFSVTTNSRVDLYGIIEGLKNIPENRDADFYLQNGYVLDTINKGWYRKWVSKKSTNKKHLDLWKEVFRFLDKRTGQTRFIHAGQVNTTPGFLKAELLAKNMARSADLKPDPWKTGNTFTTSAKQAELTFSEKEVNEEISVLVLSEFEPLNDIDWEGIREDSGEWEKGYSGNDEQVFEKEETEEVASETDSSTQDNYDELICDKEQAEEIKAEHLCFLKGRGEFRLEVNCDNLNNTEKEIVRKWGHWFRALEEGKLRPFTKTQERFIAVMKGVEDEFTLEEKAWRKYSGRIEYLEKKPDTPKLKYTLDGDTFYRREDVAKMKGTMMGTIHSTHTDGAQMGRFGKIKK